MKLTVNPQPTTHRALIDKCQVLPIVYGGVVTRLAWLRKECNGIVKWKLVWEALVCYESRPAVDTDGWMNEWMDGWMDGCPDWHAIVSVWWEWEAIFPKYVQIPNPTLPIQLHRVCVIYITFILHASHEIYFVWVEYTKSNDAVARCRACPTYRLLYKVISARTRGSKGKAPIAFVQHSYGGAKLKHKAWNVWFRSSQTPDHYHCVTLLSINDNEVAMTSKPVYLLRYNQNPGESLHR